MSHRGSVRLGSVSVMREIDDAVSSYTSNGKGKYKCARNGKMRKTPCATCPNAAKCAVGASK